MRLSNAEKLKMVLEHLEDGIPLQTLAAKYQNHLSNIKHFVALYRLHGKGVFVDRGPHIEYTREFKLNAIKRAMNENISYLKLAVELGLIDPHSVRDWLALYEKKGESGIQTTHARVPYLKHPERLDKIADKSLKDRLEYLEAENAYLKNCTPSFKREANQRKENKSDLRTEGTIFSTYLVKPSRDCQVQLFLWSSPSRRSKQEGSTITRHHSVHL